MLQKSGPDRSPQSLVYCKRAVTGQREGTSSRASKMLNGLLEGLCLYSEMLIFAIWGRPLQVKKVKL